METIRRSRAMASLCRQTSAHYPDRRWKLLAEAEFWEHLADDILRGGSNNSGLAVRCQQSERIPNTAAPRACMRA